MVACTGSANIARAQQGTEQLLAAAGPPPEHQLRVIDAIVRSAEAAIESSRPANGGNGGNGPKRPAGDSGGELTAWQCRRPGRRTETSHPFR